MWQPRTPAWRLRCLPSRCRPCPRVPAARPLPAARCLSRAADSRARPGSAGCSQPYRGLRTPPGQARLARPGPRRAARCRPQHRPGRRHRRLPQQPHPCPVSPGRERPIPSSRGKAGRPAAPSRHAHLNDEGLVYTVPQRGTYVAEPSRQATTPGKPLSANGAAAVPSRMRLSRRIPRRPRAAGGTELDRHRRRAGIAVAQEERNGNANQWPRNWLPSADSVVYLPPTGRSHRGPAPAPGLSSASVSGWRRCRARCRRWST